MNNDEYKEVVQERRKANLLLLLENFRSRKQFCETVDLHTQQLSRFLTEGGSAKNIGPSLCRKWERALGKPIGWMDDDHSDIVNIPINAEKLAESIIDLNDYLLSHDISPLQVTKQAYKAMLQDVIVQTVTMNASSVLNIERMLIQSKLQSMTVVNT